ncbi:MAG: DUF1573 domain-containing protein [bacterium]
MAFTLIAPGHIRGQEVNVVVGDFGVLPEELEYEFGHIGIDYTVYHLFPLVNRTDSRLRIIDAVSSCDCSSVTILKREIEPGDTTFFRLTFNTKDFYGLTKHTFTVTLDRPSVPTIEYAYTAIIGQWYRDLQPKPAALFFLPSHNSKKISINNTSFKEIQVSVLEQADTSFTVNFRKDRAARDKAVQLEVTPRSDLARGSHHSSLTLQITKEGQTRPTRVTIPVTVARY